MAVSFAFAGGVLLLLALPALPSAAVALALAGLLACCAALSRRRPMAALLCCGVLGFLYAEGHAYRYMTQRWPAALEGERVIATVIVDSVPAESDGAWVFDGAVSIEAPASLVRALRARLVSWDARLKPRAGERWRLLLTLAPPRARLNPGSPDMERILFHDRIHALGTVVNSSFNQRLDDGHRPLNAVRERIALRIHEQVADREAAALIAALAVGVTGAMSHEQWRVFNATGTTHLVAISGLHVTLFAVVAFAAARALWTAVLYRIVPWKRETFAAAVGFIAAVLYATLAGLSVPTQRTLIMLGVWLLVRSMARASAPFHSLALALLAVLLLDPFAPLAAGFWLSFGAMVAIVLVTSGRFIRRPVLVEALVVQAVVSLALVPLTLASFGSVSLIGPLANLLAVPAMSWVLVPTILGSVVLWPVTPALSEQLVALAAWMHDIGWPWLVAAADVPWALVRLTPPAWWYGLAIVTALACLIPLPLRLRVAVLLPLLPLMFAGASQPESGAAEVSILDVGQGTSIVVQTAHHVLVYGTGNVYGSEGRTTERTLVPFLRSRGVRRVDVLVLERLGLVDSHGLTALLAELPVDRVVLGGEAPPDLRATSCHEMPAWRWDDVRFAFVQARSGMSTSEVCVLVIESGVARVLIPGDVDASAERQLIAAGEPLLSQAVVVPRGGSDSASTPEFVRAVRADWAVVSGRRMQGGQERPALRRWREAGASVFSTAESGTVRLRMHPATGIPRPEAERAARRALWRASAPGDPP